jgi:hypothetical protein
MDYKIYKLDNSGKIDGTAIALECDNDAAALILAREQMDGHTIEIWQGVRLVSTIPSEPS